MKCPLSFFIIISPVFKVCECKVDHRFDAEPNALELSVSGIISSAIAGSSLMIVADLIARTLVQPAELPVGLITSAIGSPFFLYLIIRSKKL